MKTHAWISMAFAIHGALACGGSAKKPPEPPDLERKVRIAVTADEDGNRGRPVQLLVRAVTREAFLQESYEQVSELVFQPDPTVLGSLTVIPGGRDALTVELPPGGLLGVYALLTDPRLTDPTRRWSEAFDPGELAKRGVLRVRVREDHLTFDLAERTDSAGRAPRAE